MKTYHKKLTITHEPTDSIGPCMYYQITKEESTFPSIKVYSEKKKSVFPVLITYRDKTGI